MHVTCLSQYTFYNFIPLTLFGEQYTFLCHSMYYHMILNINKLGNAKRAHFSHTYSLYLIIYKMIRHKQYTGHNMWVTFHHHFLTFLL
jgi:hypothetical protein